jgi:hypothetical protein
MTLISTYINKFGIIMASDSNLSTNSGNSGFGQKVFPIPHLNAGLSYSGIYTIDGLDLDDWMSQFILNESFISNTLEDFVENLTRALTTYIPGHASVTILHVCGFYTLDYTSYCKHWHISNSDLDPNTGSYIIKNDFSCNCDFDSFNEGDLEKLTNLDLNPFNNQLYLNGYPPGRTSLLAIRTMLEDIIYRITLIDNWDFRAPKNIYESATLIRLYYHILGEMFKLSDHNAMYVGGETQIHLIPAPSNLKKSYG